MADYPWGGMESSISEQPTFGMACRIDVRTTSYILGFDPDAHILGLTRRSKWDKKCCNTMLDASKSAKLHQIMYKAKDGTKCWLQFKFANRIHYIPLLQSHGNSTSTCSERRKIAARLHATALKTVLVSWPWIGAPWNGFTNVAALGSGALELEHIEILRWSHMVPQRKKSEKIFKGILRVVFTTKRSENTSVWGWIYNSQLCDTKRIQKVWTLWPIDLKSFEWDHHTFNERKSQGMSLLISRPQCYQNRSVFTQIHDSEYMYNFRTGFKAEKTTNFLRYHERGTNQDWKRGSLNSFHSSLHPIGRKLLRCCLVSSSYRRKPGHNTSDQKPAHCVLRHCWSWRLSAYQPTVMPTNRLKAVSSRNRHASPQLASESRESSRKFSNSPKRHLPRTTHTFQAKTFRVAVLAFVVLYRTVHGCSG